MKAPHFARTAVTFLAAATVAALGGGPASAAPPHPQYPQYPVNYNLISAFATGTFNGNVPPPGANRTNCRSTTHPVPVVLVHGTGANQNNSWQAIAPELANRGYCVFTTTIGQLPNLPNFGELASIYTSASQLAAFVRKVQAWTGAPKVDLVGHSQGGAINLIYLKDHDGWKNTRRVIGLAAANNSPKFWANLVSMIPGASTISGALIPAGNQLLDPATYARLTPRTYPQVQYSNLVSRFDELAIPSTVAFLPPGPNVRNLLVQQICPNSVVGHVGMIADPSVTQMLLNELDPAHRRPVSCAVTGVPF